MRVRHPCRATWPCCGSSCTTDLSVWFPMSFRRRKRLLCWGLEAEGVRWSWRYRIRWRTFAMPTSFGGSETWSTTTTTSTLVGQRWSCCCLLWNILWPLKWNKMLPNSKFLRHHHQGSCDSAVTFGIEEPFKTKARSTLRNWGIFFISVVHFQLSRLVRWSQTSLRDDHIWDKSICTIQAT